MKILIVSQHYWPENFRITDIAETLVQHGNDVTVLAGIPNYPLGYYFDGYKHGENRIQEHNGVKIIRSFEIQRKNNIFFRVLNYWSFPFFCKKTMKRMKDEYDVVFANEISPITSYSPAIYYKKKTKTPVLMYEMDLWPESLLAGGVKKDSLIYNHYKKVSSKIYSGCDKILVATKEHSEYIKNLNKCSQLDIDYLPQYAEAFFENMEVGTKEENDKHINLMFAGNIGKAQSVKTIIEAASILKDDKRFLFHIVGDGSEYNNIQKMVSELELNNVILYGRKKIEEMPLLYKIADAMLVSLENKTYANMTIPGKVQSYMAAGKPIIGSVSGSTSSFIKENNIGFVAEAGDSVALASIIQQLSIKELESLGANARIKYFQFFAKEKFFNKLELELINLKEGR